jgi:hypothetical protein
VSRSRVRERRDEVDVAVGPVGKTDLDIPAAARGGLPCETEGVWCADETGSIDGQLFVDEFEFARAGDVSSAIEVGSDGLAILEELVLLPYLLRVGYRQSKD